MTTKALVFICRDAACCALYSLTTGRGKQRPTYNEAWLFNALIIQLPGVQETDHLELPELWIETARVGLAQ